MSVWRDLLSGVRETIILSNKVDEVARNTEKALAQTQELRDRVTRVEIILDFATRRQPRLPH